MPIQIKSMDTSQSIHPFRLSNRLLQLQETKGNIFNQMAYEMDPLELPPSRDSVEGRLSQVEGESEPVIHTAKISRKPKTPKKTVKKDAEEFTKKKAKSRKEAAAERLKKQKREAAAERLKKQKRAAAAALRKQKKEAAGNEVASSGLEPVTPPIKRRKTAAPKTPKASKTKTPRQQKEDDIVESLPEVTDEQLQAFCQDREEVEYETDENEFE